MLVGVPVHQLADALGELLGSYLVISGGVAGFLEEGAPEGVDKQGVLQARAALRTPEIQELLATSREPMSPRRFAKNIAFALSGGRSLQLDDDPVHYLSR